LIAASTIGTLRGRLGYAFDNTLFYATGGLAYGHVKSFTHIFSAPNPELIGTEDSWKVGWTIGAGVEHMFAPNWSVKGEYLYYDLGNSNVNLLPAGGAWNSLSSATRIPVTSFVPA
jgi:outer membrane immunogenic protein